MTQDQGTTSERPTEPTAPAAPPDPPSRRRLHGLRIRVRAFRMKVRARPHWNFAWRFGIGFIGTVVLILGVIAIPYPGPGWLIVFTGLGILSTEFEWAGRVLRFARRYYDRWVAWVKRQNKVVQLLLALATGLIVLATLWLLDALWIVAKLVGLGHWTWLHSPIMA
ncbi:TIGR02611 family protein [Actinomycetospora soli]|uniref:TIGR02611 family protein n=1 Tax=Actinomycetospora soli TaxID=2893887 RepID=UPI001E34086A|nr:TIGR02611 family protein [Actinomycetospora soli]MCD2188247.1 TIGR02611 family protein [Actinomycetospora soli]